MTDPVDMLASVVAEARAGRKLSNMLRNVRRVDESDEATLERLMRERAAVVRILRQRGARCRDFDITYGWNFVDVVRETFGAEEGKDEDAA